jgi:hypothetical protein
MDAAGTNVTVTRISVPQERLVLFRTGIFKQSMGARNQVGIGLSYRHAMLHRLELIPGLLISLKIRAQDVLNILYNSVHMKCMIYFKKNSLKRSITRVHY